MKILSESRVWAALCSCLNVAGRAVYSGWRLIMVKFLLAAGQSFASPAFDERFRQSGADIAVFDARGQSGAPLSLRLAAFAEGVRNLALPALALPALALIVPQAIFTEAEGEKQLRAAAAAGVSLFLIAAEGAGNLPWAKAAAFAQNHEALLLLPWQRQPQPLKQQEEPLPCRQKPPLWHKWQKKAQANGFRGLIFCCADLPAQNRAAALAALGQAVEELRRQGLRAGISGALQLPDIPRLLPFSPDYIGFSCEDLPAGAPGGSALIGDFAALARPPAAATAGQSAEGEVKREIAPADKILISDFIVPMHIGAYAHEKKAAQRVCFNVAAELARSPAAAKAAPRRLSDIFSYDIILDAIMRLAAEEHMELVESAAERLAAFLLGFPQVERVTVRVEKLDLAPRAAGVEIIRSKADYPPLKR